MKLESEQKAAEVHADMPIDRRIIRVEAPSAHGGIMAALRRAFDAAACEPSNRDFDDLLRRLN